jgi:hypothetical protein
MGFARRKVFVQGDHGTIQKVNTGGVQSKAFSAAMLRQKRLR